MRCTKAGPVSAIVVSVMIIELLYSSFIETTETESEKSM